MFERFLSSCVAMHLNYLLWYAHVLLDYSIHRRTSISANGPVSRSLSCRNFLIQQYGLNFWYCDLVSLGVWTIMRPTCLSLDKKKSSFTSHREWSHGFTGCINCTVIFSICCHMVFFIEIQWRILKAHVPSWWCTCPDIHQACPPWIFNVHKFLTDEWPSLFLGQCMLSVGPTSHLTISRIFTCSMKVLLHEIIRRVLCSFMICWEMMDAVFTFAASRAWLTPLRSWGRRQALPNNDFWWPFHTVYKLIIICMPSIHITKCSIS